MDFEIRLTLEVEDDIANIDTIYGMLDVRGIDGLTQSDIEDLIEFSENMGHSASMARSLLMLKGYRFGTNYVLPDPDPEPFIWLPENTTPAFEEISVYPNPNAGDLVNVFVPSMDDRSFKFSLWSVHGLELLRQNLTQNFTNIRMAVSLPAGVYVYRIYREEQVFKSGRLIVTP